MGLRWGQVTHPRHKKPIESEFKKPIEGDEVTDGDPKEENTRKWENVTIITTGGAAAGERLLLLWGFYNVLWNPDTVSTEFDYFYRWPVKSFTYVI